ncbi:MAG: hypothetical protein IJV56_00520 [Neisseriaceae bacterium]|nr:hypothetical protein [Neisseriaceae bacterium]
MFNFFKKKNYELSPSFEELISKLLDRELSEEQAYQFLIKPTRVLSAPIKIYEHFNKECKRKELLLSINFSVDDGVYMLFDLIGERFNDYIIDELYAPELTRLVISDEFDNKYVLFWYDEIGNFAYAVNEEYHQQLKNRLQIAVNVINSLLENNTNSYAGEKVKKCNIK